MRKLPSTFLLSTICALALTACGGGGGGGGDTGGGAVTPVPTPPTEVPVDPNPPTEPVPQQPTGPSYTVGSGEAAAWNYLQAARTTCKFGALAQNTLLDKASVAHSNYLVKESQDTNSIVVGHYETTVNNPFYTGNDSSARAVQAGYGANVGEILAAYYEFYTDAGILTQPTDAQRGEKSIRGLMNTVYHLSGAMSSGTEGGVGIAKSETTGTLGPAQTLTVQYRFGMLLGSQNGTQALVDSIASYPCAGSTDIDYAFAPATEDPNPFPAITSPNDNVGTPLYIRSDVGTTLVVNTYSIKDASNTTVPVSTLTASNDPNGDLRSHEFFMVPNQALNPSSTYTVEYVGTVNGNPFTRTFTFTTRS